jgi:hypothetical protein
MATVMMHTDVAPCCSCAAVCVLDQLWLQLPAGLEPAGGPLTVHTAAAAQAVGDLLGDVEESSEPPAAGAARPAALHAAGVAAAHGPQPDSPMSLLAGGELRCVSACISLGKCSGCLSVHSHTLMLNVYTAFEHLLVALMALLTVVWFCWCRHFVRATVGTVQQQPSSSRPASSIRSSSAVSFCAGRQQEEEDQHHEGGLC